MSPALERSTYVWLPFVVAPDGSITIEPRERWDATWLEKPFAIAEVERALRRKLEA